MRSIFRSLAEEKDYKVSEITLSTTSLDVQPPRRGERICLGHESDRTFSADQCRPDVSAPGPATCQSRDGNLCQPASAYFGLLPCKARSSNASISSGESLRL